MAVTGVRDGFELDDHGILRDSFASDFQVDDDGILHDDLDLFKHAVSTAGHGTDSGISGDKQSSTTSTLQHMQASFDDDLAPIGDESINISDFEASKDDLDSVEGELDGDRGSGSKSFRGRTGSATPEGVLDGSVEAGKARRSGAAKKLGQAEGERHDLFSEEYYQQLRELGVLVDGADFSRDESQNDLDILESQQSQEGYDEDNRDVIGEYLQGEYGVGTGEATAGKGRKLQSRTGADSQATSTVPSVSGQSFPEMSQEERDLMYTESQQTGDDDEIFLINNHLLPGSARIQAEKLRGTPSDLGSRSNSRVSFSDSPVTLNRRRYERTRQSPAESGHNDFQGSRSETNTPHKSRPDSVASSVASENVHHLPGKSSMSKARSQESFFEQDKQLNRSRDKLTKRMLPTPNTSEANQSFRVKNKSKSVSNIANKSAPVKPTHMSISEITRITMDETGEGEGLSARDGTLDRSQGELTTQLKQESSKRKQATELVQQLQKEYDTLLSKYALAELTIDQMRLGARITLHADSPTPTSAQPGGMSPGLGGHKVQMMQLQSPSAQRAAVGHFSTGMVDGQSHASAQVQTADGRPVSTSDPADKPLSVRSSVDGTVSFGSEDRTSSVAPRTADTVKLNIQTQATSLNDRLDQFHTLMENRQFTVEEQEKAFENIRTDHEKLRRSYLQAKEDYNVLRRSGATFPETDFDGNKELEGQLFRLGMKFDEVNERVDSELKQQTTSRRQPFQTPRLSEDQGLDDVDQAGEHGSDAGNRSVDSVFEKRAGQLHDEYRALMDRYRRMQQMAPTPEQNRETDNLVRKLKDICVEMPDMFRLAPEVQERWEKLQRREQRRSPLPSGSEDSAAGGTRPTSHRSGPSSSLPGGSSKGRRSPLVGDHSISPYPSGRHRRSSRDSQLDDSFRRTPSSLSGSRSSLASGRDNSSMAGRGSYSSLADSGLSDQEGGSRHHDDALANLPGPGKMKQLTHQRGDNDMDSGFVGSVVSTGSAHLPPPDRQEPTLRLRDPPSERNQNRSRRDSSASSSTVTSTHRDSGSERRSRRSKPTTTTTTTTTTTAANNNASLSSGIGQHSIDRSYDGELDESTLSNARFQGARPKDVRPKQQKSAVKGEKNQEKRADESLRSQSTRSGRSQSNSSLQDDETLEDLSDGEITDVSTPRHTEQAEDAKRPSTKAPQSQSTTTTTSTAMRPPTPPTPSTPRPPTPYHLDRKEGTVELEISRQERAPAEATRTRSRQQSDDEAVKKASPKEQPARPRSPVPEIKAERTRDSPRHRSRRERRHDRSQDMDSVTSMESSRTGSRIGRRGSDASDRRQGEERGVGSDFDIRSDITRSSSAHSARLRAIQDEIEKLKLGVQQANDKASERPEPPPIIPPPPPPQQEGPEYYDPFDDPYGFMRMPRRRANSFSGGRVREFDEWYWALPNERRNNDEDIPLGYAAADAYNRHYREKTPEGARQRLRRRGHRHRQGEEGHPNPLDPRAMVNGEQEEVMTAAGVTLHAAAPPAPTTTTTLQPGPALQQRRPGPPDAQAFHNYYSRTGPQDSPLRIPSTNPYRHLTTPLSASQPNLAATLAGVEPPAPRYQTSHGRPWYTIRRSQWPARSSSQQYLAGSLVGSAHPQASSVSYYSSYPSSGSSNAGQSGAGLRTDVCPLCGGSGTHVHEDKEGRPGYSTHDLTGRPGSKRRGRSRQRSRSASRSRHYSKRSSSQNRYRVKEYRDRSSSSEDSDPEGVRLYRRSRSLSRSLSLLELRPSSRRSSRHRSRRRRRRRDWPDMGDNGDLNESLALSENMSRLTNRMLGAVRGELRRHGDDKDFGSSYW